MYGTVRASGSAARIAAFIASTSSPSNVVSYDGRSAIHSRVTSGPISLVDLPLERRQPAGQHRQSTTASAVAGMTLAL